MTDEPRGRYRTEGENGQPNMVLVEAGTLGFDIPEQEYRERGFEPAFEELPWETPHRFAERKEELLSRTSRQS